MTSEAPEFFQLEPDDEDPAYELARPVAGENYQRFGYRMAFHGGWIDDPPAMRLTVDSDDLFDVQDSVHGFYFFSRRLRDALDAARGPNDVVQWFPATITDRGGREHPYWAPHFPELPEVLDDIYTTWGEPGHVIRWVLDPAKIGSRRFFRPKHCADSEIIVSEDMVRVLREAGVMHGVAATRARSLGWGPSAAWPMQSPPPSSTH